MNNTPRPRKQPTMTNECRRCGKPERGYEARHSYATQRFEPTRSPSKLGRFCQPCAVEVAHEKNLEHTGFAEAFGVGHDVGLRHRHEVAGAEILRGDEQAVRMPRHPRQRGGVVR